MPTRRSGHRAELGRPLRRRQVRHDHQRLLDDQHACSATTGVETGLAPTPIGPSGKRASMYNGLADSIWVGSENKAGRGQVGRVPRLAGLPEHRRRGGASCSRPSRPATDKAEAAFKAKGVDVTAVPGPGGREDDLPVPDHRLRLPDHRHHDAGDGRRWSTGKADARVADRGQQPGQPTVRIARHGAPAWGFAPGWRPFGCSRLSAAEFRCGARPPHFHAPRKRFRSSSPRA